MDYIFFDYNDIDKNLKSKITKGSIIPRPIAWISTLNQDQSVNLAPFSFFNAISENYLAVSITPGKYQKHTLTNLLREKEAVINIADESLYREVNLSSKNLEKNVSEVKYANLTLRDSLKIKTPQIKETLISFEVILHEHIEITNEKLIEANLLILKIIGVSLHNSIFDKEKTYIIADKLKPLIRLAGNDFATITKIKD